MTLIAVEVQAIFFSSLQYLHLKRASGAPSLSQSASQKPVEQAAHLHACVCPITGQHCIKRSPHTRREATRPQIVSFLVYFVCTTCRTRYRRERVEGEKERERRRSSRKNPLTDTFIKMEPFDLWKCGHTAGVSLVCRPAVRNTADKMPRRKKN